MKRLADHIARVEAEQDAQFEALSAAERAQAGDATTPAALSDNAVAPPATATPAEPMPRERPRGPRVRML